MNTIDAMKQAHEVFKSGENLYHIGEILAEAIAHEEAQTVEPVYLVATGIVHDGQETYTRYDVRPPLCDAEKLFTRPAPPPSGEREALIKRLRNGSNWLIQGYGSFKDCVSKYDRAPFEAADMLAADTLQSSESAVAERDELRAKLSALEGQEAVAWADRDFVDLLVERGGAAVSEHRNEITDIPLYLAAGAAQPVSAAVPAGERETLIEDCSTYAKVGVSQEARRLVRRCADMLAAPPPPAPVSAKPPLDVCTGGENCRRCTTPMNHRGDIPHAGPALWGIAFGATQPASAKPLPLPLTDAINALLYQIDIGDFTDSHGHSAKMLKPVHDLMKIMSTLGITQEPTK